MISVHFCDKPFNITVIRVYAPTTNAEEAEVEQFHEELQPFRKHQKRCPFHHRGLECKSRKSRDTFNNGQVWPWSTKSSRERLTEFCQENTLVIANTLFQQQKRRLYTWTSPDGQYRKQIDYILFSQRWRIFIWSAKTRPETAMAQIMNFLLQN